MWWPGRAAAVRRAGGPAGDQEAAVTARRREARQHNHTRHRVCNWSCPAHPEYVPPEERQPREASPPVGELYFPDVLVKGTLGSGWEC